MLDGPAVCDSADLVLVVRDQGLGTHGYAPTIERVTDGEADDWEWNGLKCNVIPCAMSSQPWSSPTTTLLALHTDPVAGLYQRYMTYILACTSSMVHYCIADIVLANAWSNHPS